MSSIWIVYEIILRARLTQILYKSTVQFNNVKNNLQSMICRLFSIIIRWRSITDSHSINMFKVTTKTHHGVQLLAVQLYFNLTKKSKIITVQSVKKITV